MKITSIKLYAIHLPLENPFIVSYDTYHHMPSIIAKVETDEGLCGYGESVPDEFVTGESFESTYALLKHTLAPALIGKNPMEFEMIHEVMNQIVYGVPAAKAGLDIACFDLAGKKLGVPVYGLIGGRYHEKFPLTHVLSIGEPDHMAAEALEMLQQGYSSFKMKVGTDPRIDVKRIQAVRRSVGEEAAIRVDVNQGWKNSAIALTAMRSLKDLDIDWIEQPVAADDIDGIVEIKSKTDVPLMIDEGMKGPRELNDIIQKRAADKVNIKLMKCGGILPAVKLAYQSEMAGIDCQVGSMVESSIGSAAGFHVAFSKKNITSVELTGPLKFTKDIGTLHYDVPFIQLNEEPGLGIEINEHVLEELTQYSCTVA